MRATLQRRHPEPSETERSEDHSDTGATVLLVDDHALMRSALKLLLETLGHNVIEVASAEAAVSSVTHECVDVVLMDVRMPGKDGLWALREIRRTTPEVPVVMLSFFADEPSVREALASGAAGYLLKDADVHQVVDSIATAIEGKGVYLHPLAAECLLERRLAAGEELTAREMEVLALLVEGATNDAIASKLFITGKTVKTHLTGIFRKLGVANRTQAATKALRESLVTTTGFGS